MTVARMRDGRGSGGGDDAMMDVNYDDDDDDANNDKNNNSNTTIKHCMGVREKRKTAAVMDDQ